MHGVGGCLGTLLTAVFAQESFGGVGLSNGIGKQFLIQLTGVSVTIIWCAVFSYIIFKIVDAMIGLRVTEEQETEGLDLVLHDERGYNM